MPGSNNGSKKKYTLNDNFFESIKKPEQAYFLGLLQADGYVAADDINGRNKNEIRLGLQEDDADILYSFKSFIETNRPLYFDERSRPEKGVYTIVINSKKMKTDLITLGVKPRKSLSLKFPESIYSDLLPHMIRGYFDGDGCIRLVEKDKNTRATISICVSLDYGKTLCQVLKSVLNINAGLYMHGKIHQLRIEKSHDVKVFLDWIYNKSEPNLRLKRKFDKYVIFTKIGRIKQPFITFKKCKEYARSFGIETSSAWNRHIKECSVPENVPHRPNAVYSQWSGWRDFLGTSK